MKQISYFFGVKTTEEARHRFRILSKKLHPDTPTGDTEQFQELLSQYNEYKQRKDTGQKSTLEKFTEFLDMFKGLYRLEKVDDQWVIHFAEYISSEFIAKFSLDQFLHQNQLAEIRLEGNSPAIVISKSYSQIFTALFSLYELMRVPK